MTLSPAVTTLPTRETRCQVPGVRSPPPPTPDTRHLAPIVFHGTRPGWIEVITGVMFSGKSEELIRRVRRAAIARKRVQVFKSHLDARYAGLYNVASHDGVMVEAEPIDSAGQILRRTHPATEGG